MASCQAAPRAKAVEHTSDTVESVMVTVGCIVIGTVFVSQPTCRQLKGEFFIILHRVLLLAKCLVPT